MTPGGTITSTPALGHVPALDGLRAAAVLLVMALHSHLPVNGGHVGVNIFFVLSGFLITTLLLQEHAATGRIGLAKFYLRRTLRLLPAFLSLVGVVTLYQLAVPNAVRAEETAAGTWPALLYYANWVRAFGGIDRPGLLGHAWSLSVEEQFYFVWPLLLLVVLGFLRGRNRLVGVLAFAVVGSVASLIARLVIAPGENAYARMFNGLDTQADQLLIGCGLAAGVALVSSGTTRLRRVAAVCVWPAVTVLVGAAFLWSDESGLLHDRLILTVVALATATVIAHLVLTPTSYLASALSLRPARWIGRRSYSLYLWHFPAFLVVQEMATRTFGLMSPTGKISVLVAQWALATALACVSFRFVERPALHFKGWLENRPRPRHRAGSGSVYVADSASTRAAEPTRP